MIPAHQAQAYRQNIIISVLLTCVGYAFYNIGDAALKIVSSKFHISQLMLMSPCVILPFMATYGWLKDGKKAFTTKKPGLMFIRAALSQVTTVCNIFAFAHVPLTTFYTLVFTAPFWVALLSVHFLKDKLDMRRLGVILFGFMTIFFIFRPGGEMFNIWSFLVLLGAFFYSCQMILIRHIGSGESRSFMFMCGSVMSIVLALPFVGSHFVMPTAYEWGLFLMIGLTNSIGLLSVSYAFQSAPSASLVAPYHYTQIIWGTLLGYFLFNEIPGMETMVGAGLIIMAGLYLIFHETRQSNLKAIGAA